MNDQLLSCCFIINTCSSLYIIFIYLFIYFRGFSISEDTQVVLSDDDSGVSAFVSCVFLCLSGGQFLFSFSFHFDSFCVTGQILLTGV